MAKEKEKKKNRRRKIIYIIACTVFALPLALVLMASLLNKSTTTPPLIMCLNETGNCSSSNYKTNVGCFVNDSIINSNGGNPCTTTCKNNILSYNCQCPVKKVWDPPVLTCTMACLNESADCSIYTSGNHCVPIIDTNKGKDCLTSCNNSVGSYECVCMPGYQWDKKKLFCALICVNATTMACTDISSNSSSCIAPPSNLSVSDPNTEKRSNCLAYCPVNGTNLDYDCSCEIGYHWKSENHNCQLMCMNCTVFEYNNQDCYLKHQLASNCKHDCTVNQGIHLYYMCDCPMNYIWNFDTLDCLPMCHKFINGQCLNEFTNKPCLDSEYNDCKMICVNETQKYKCYCDPLNEFWDFTKRRCQLICKKISNVNCSKSLTDNRYCTLQTPIPNQEGTCKSHCDDQGSQTYDCECKTDFTWHTIDMKCLIGCPYLDTIDSFKNTYPDPTRCIAVENPQQTFNCVSNWDPIQCIFYFCDCPPGLFFDTYSRRCFIKCEINSSNIECSSYKDTRCAYSESIRQNVGICTTMCDTLNGRSFKCRLCFEGGTWDESINDCKDRNCRTSTNSDDTCKRCGSWYRPGQNCTNGSQTCKTKCSNNLIDFDLSSCH